MVDREGIVAGLEQMQYELVDTGQIELPTSTPATYLFSQPATPNPDAFESRLDEHGFSVFDVTHKQKESGSFYYFADVQTDHYKRLTVKVWELECCIFPSDDIPDVYELSRILHAIEDGFAAELEHDLHETTGCPVCGKDDYNKWDTSNTESRTVPSWAESVCINPVAKTLYWHHEDNE